MKDVDKIAELFLQIKDKEEMKNFLRGLFTQKELETISTRIQIVKMLKKQIPHHDIAKKLGVGVSTVTRGSKEIQQNRFTHITV